MKFFSRFPLLFWPLLFLWTLAPGCTLLGKVDGAVEPEGTDWTTIVADCKVQNYKVLVEPALQSRCVSCHQSGGSGAGKYQLFSGSSLSDSQLGENYSSALQQLLDDDGGAYDTNPLLLYPAGATSHPMVISVSDGDYLNVVEWIIIQRDSPEACVMPAGL